MTKGEHEDIIQTLSKSKILVIGDLILDIHREGKTIGVSVETPTLVVKHKDSRVSHGGAGLFVRNVLALGGQVTFVTLLGDDEYAAEAENFSHPNLQKVIFREKGRITTVKERFWSGSHKLLCWDRLDNRPISSQTEEIIFSFVKENLPAFDKLIVSDYRHGLISKELANRLVRLAKETDKPIYVDSQVAQNFGNHKWYVGANLFCLNEKEALSIDREFNNASLEESLARLSKILGGADIILKLGERGSVSIIRGRYIATEPYRVEAVDTIGAGDAFFAVLALTPHMGLENYLKLANVWAALAVTVKGAHPPTLEMLKNASIRY